MNAPEDMNVQPLPVPADGRDVVNAETVYDAELVDETKPFYYQPRLGRFASWWLRSPRIPIWLKSRQHFSQVLKDLAVAILQAPWRCFGAVVRGIVAAARWWRRWVTVRDFREAAELSEKLADKFVEIRALTLFRWKVTGAVVVSTVVGLLIADLVYGRRSQRRWRSWADVRTAVPGARPCSLGRAR